jgi:hypothetical protein
MRSMSASSAFKAQFSIGKGTSTGGHTGGGVQLLPDPLPESLPEPVPEHLPEFLPEFLPEPLPQLLLPQRVRLRPQPPLTSSNSLNSNTRMVFSCEARPLKGTFQVNKRCICVSNSSEPSTK